MVIEENCSSETSISPHTNKPLHHTIDSKSSVKCANIVFWCETCHTKLHNASMAVQHLSGRSHKFQVSIANKPPDEGNSNTTLKRTLESSSNKTKAEEVLVDNTKSKKQKHDLVAENKDEVDAGLTCEVCDKVFTSSSFAIQHFKGKKHASKVELAYQQKKEQSSNADLKCEICDKEFISALHAVQHFKGTKHATKMELNSQKKKEAESPEPILNCEVCNKVFTSNLLATEHFQGKKHASKIASQNDPLSGKKDISKVEPVSKKKKEDAKLNPNLKCEICDKTFTSDALAVDHFKGKKHTSKVAAKMLKKQKSQTGGNRGRWNGGFRRGNTSFRADNNSGFQYQSQLGLQKYADQYFYDNQENTVAQSNFLESNGWYQPLSSVTNEI